MKGSREKGGVLVPLLFLEKREAIQGHKKKDASLFCKEKKPVDDEGRRAEN